ncbi:ABC transporter permease [Streptomyces bohaiensis]|uniref:ABC transporter permease n=1 Tax=Streptomyces bohaiensis TaxID=1431344 RepID=A0ABX1CDI3_9ACTN|nr:ABC transporter permease [Streptomyces bohaiensis]NJQ15835.1 ABC transporter permease [Streptomyces bohaiensis]
MNFVKRATLSLWSRKVRTLLTLAAFVAITAMALAGVLINDATARAEQDARRSVGAEVTLAMDLGSLGTGGGGFLAPRVAAATVDQLGALPQVRAYSYTTWDRVILPDGHTLVEGAEVDFMGPGGTAGVGVLDSSLLPDFRSGRLDLVAGEHLTADDAGRNHLLIEQRLAERNGLAVGDTITLTGNDETTTAEFTVTGVYQDPRPATDAEPEYGVSPANMVYSTAGGIAALGSENEGPLQVGQATFLLEDAALLAEFQEEAERTAGPALDGFVLETNDRAVQQMTGPLASVRSVTTAAAWLGGIAGAAVLALLVHLAVRQRRTEFGVLLALGERRPRIIGQQVVETLAVAALAFGLSALLVPALTERAGAALLDREAAAAERKLDAWEPPPPGSTGIDQGSDPDSRPVENADPISEMTVALAPSDLAVLGAVGLGTGLLATAVPVATVLRLSPRTILTKGT